MAVKKKWDKDAKIKKAIRLIWAFSPGRRSMLTAAKVRPGYYKCSLCARETEKPAVDHVVPVGLAVDWNSFISEMFHGTLQVLCRECHHQKGLEDLKKIREQKNDSKS